MILKALKSFSWSYYNSKNGSRIHDLTSKPVTVGSTSLYSSPFWLLLLSSGTLNQSLSADWHAFPSWLLGTFCLGNVPYLFFPYVSWWGKSRPYQIFRRYHYLPIFLLALSILCLGLRRAVWFRNRKSRDRQTGTAQGTEETLKEEQCVLCCVLVWLRGSKCWFILWGLDRNCMYVSQESLEYLGNTCELICFLNMLVSSHTTLQEL